MNLDKLIGEIEYLTEELMMGIDEEFSDKVKSVVSSFMETIPSIIIIYNHPLMKDKSSEAVYWPAQVERLLEAFDRSDEVYLADVLYNETRQMLIELREDLKERGLNNE